MLYKYFPYEYILTIEQDCLLVHQKHDAPPRLERHGLNRRSFRQELLVLERHRESEILEVGDAENSLKIGSFLTRELRGIHAILCAREPPHHKPQKLKVFDGCKNQQIIENQGFSNASKN